MDYKVEVLGTNKTLFEKVYRNMSHPNQAIRKTLSLNYFNGYLTVYVMNTNGERWVYGVKQQDNTYKTVPISHDYRDKGDVMRVFSGTIKIRGLAR